MTDDLVKRLRDWSEYDEGKINDARAEAADRIEALGAKLAEVSRDGERVEYIRKDVVDAEYIHKDVVQDLIGMAEPMLMAALGDEQDKAQAAEAKLAKAVDALRTIVDSYEVASELHASVADLADNLYDHAAAVLDEIAPTEEPTP